VNATIGSLCSGYGGLDLAVERFFGARTAWFSEYDAAPSKVLAYRWPGVPNLGDMTSIDWATVPPVDIIAGGTPCQDLSAAGKRKGMTEGTRSNLWVQMREAVATIRPSLVIWENVRGAYSACADSDVGQCPRCVGKPGKHRPFLRALGRVLGDLSDLGFDAEVVGLRAADAGAPHERFRVFVVAYRDGAGLGGFRHGDGNHPHRRTGARPLQTRALLPTPAAMNPNDGEDVENWEARRLRTKARVGNGNGFGTPLSIAAQLLPTPSVADATGGHARRGGDRGDELLLPGIAESLNTGTWGEYADAIARWETMLGRPAPEPTLPDGKGGKRRLNARLVEWMMGQDDGWVTDPVIGLTRKEQLKALGNGVVTQQAELALEIAWARILEAVAA
jgi:DNA (cytosine-5)-methyltransferase 1